jgi:hypothetical protein
VQKIYETPIANQEDEAWAILADKGMTKVYHLPSLPMTINETDLITAKG